MPMLAQEPNVYPLDIFDGPEAGAGRNWWVLHTKPRQEKALARQLLQAKIPFYLPLLKRKTLVSGRVMQSHVPLFTSYLFLLGKSDERITALATKRIVRSLDVRQPRELQEQLAQIHRLINSGKPVTPEQQLYPGAFVEICTGPLAGLRGKIIREGNRSRFVVQVDFIQKSASVELDDFMLQAIKE